ncbi:MAG: CBM20 domain-containing protein, partial [Bacteroidota bacterium]|nr:CBM20 domain-containing protein [Bacteroidota bacterium]
MTIHFYLGFHTVFGQVLCISGNNDLMGNNDSDSAKELSFLNEDYWHVKIELPAGFDDTIIYKYFLRDKDGAIVFDGEENRAIDLSEIKSQSICVYDAWNGAGDLGNVFFTRPFSQVLLEHVTKIKPAYPKRITHEFRVKGPLLQSG